MDTIVELQYESDALFPFTKAILTLSSQPNVWFVATLNKVHVAQS